ncbi:hypothetical protein GGR20_003259 [Devosia subaequoris]|uniref:DUF5681 domain-containing protein n=1 Tax=Devosia subaequoris TaxID=395930 RepID=A0A7W6IPT2_9HYPH|nr:DUF5681 domain-containing protein [Devosia subaequoris]MBB4053597.1 hypothetical protein [Devosia subaequoris]MCP1211607.1 DUF5681 domain-containing protein [Devosia subaequoris]
MAGKKSKNGSGDYTVGRGKPPVASRFKPGQSGNPGGRKKGSRNYKTILAEVMESEIAMTDNGRKRTVTRFEALLLCAVQEAKHDPKVRSDLFDRYERCDDGASQIQEELPEEDREIIDRGRQRAGAKMASNALNGDEGAPDDD